MASVRFELILNTEPEQFRLIERRFLTALATVMKTQPSELWIIDIHRGCTILLVQGPADEVRAFISEMNAAEPSQEVLAFINNENVRRGFRLDAIVHRVKRLRKIGLLPAERGPASETVTWLHLSDLHFRADGGGDAYVQDAVTARFLEHLPILLSAQRLSPEFIFFTGDIAFSGQKKEYEAASKFLDTLLRSFDRKPRLFFVPGNHDVTWQMVNKELDIKLRRDLTSDVAVSKHLLDDSQSFDRQAGFLRLQEYNRFADSCATFQQPARNHEYFYTTAFEHKGLKIGVCGLNSAWRCTRKDSLPANELITDPDFGSLLLGKPQMRTAVEAMKDCDLRIALLHHPALDSWFKDFDKQAQANNLSEFDYVLRGHEHVFIDSVIGRWNFPYTMQLSAGALYQVDPWPKIFSAIVIELETGMQTVFKWKYDSDDEKWHAIIDVGQDQPGYRGVLPKRLVDRLAASLHRSV
jgi:3',5'-cyclic AMP phosphodiesterase CpdA